MAAPDNIGEASALGRSSSMDARESLSRSDSQRRSRGGRRGPRSGNELFVCFAPRTSLNLVSRPVLSPAREKGKEHSSATRRPSTGASSIFTKAGPKKQGFEVEEPTSPKVTCIGQVRVRHKKRSKEAALLKGKQQKSRKATTDSGLDGQSHKESACSSFGKDFSCFGLPCDSYGSLPSFRGDKKSGGAVFAKSLVLIQQETDESPETKKSSMKKQSEPLPTQIETRKSPASRFHEVNEVAVVEVPEEESVPQFSVGEALTAEANNAEQDKPDDEKQQQEPISETEMEEDDTFEPEPPPPNALLLMRHKAEHLRVSVPPPSLNISLRRSISAPVQCRSKEEEEDKQSEAGICQTKLKKGRNSAKPTTVNNNNNQKSFFKRCKSVSQSLTRSSNTRGSIHPTEKTKEKPFEEDVVASQPCESETAVVAHKEEDGPDKQSMMNVGGSESESLKVSLDFVPETWLWERCTIVRHPKSEKRQVDNKQGAEWLDAELEASLWKSCKRPEPPRVKDDSADTIKPALADTEVGGNWLDAEVEATLWRSCRVATSTQHDPSCKEEEDSVRVTARTAMEPNVSEGTEELVEEKKNAPVLRRSCSVGSQGGKHLEKCGSLWRTSSVESQDGKYLERGGLLCRSCSVGSQGGQVLDGGPILKERVIESNLGKIEIARLREGGAENFAVCIVQNDDTPMVDFNEGKCTCDSKQGEEDLPVPSEERQDGHDGTIQLPSGELKSIDSKEALPSQMIVDTSPTAAPAPAPSPSSETLLFLRYNLGAFRISLDTSESMLLAEKAIDKDGEEQQQKSCMMKRLQEVGTYTRLLKASSGKEHVSLSSAFRLQRCKSEPVRLTPYGYL